MADDPAERPPRSAAQRTPVEFVAAKITVEIAQILFLVVSVQDAVGGGEDPVGVEDCAATGRAVW